ncbi:glycine transferase [Romboutsia maritimum]|uniref:Glycine transferase n=1 Tax=Romboutsia maritimum TaxID=2020948 RepID=A0A371IRR7_9FIRM|nr:WbqC family protein [Romboutsia maritimum]RDY23169.1 glycine transferase [Romboutsia maritimum]
MKVGIMQPYFFPYLGYFQLINYVDKWIFFDDVQYIYHGWINRNRIIHPKKGWQYIILPLKKHSRGDLIKDIKVNNDQRWKDELLGKLTIYKKRAPNYNEAIDVIQKSINIDTDNITQLNAYIISTICNYLDINFEYEISSKCDFDYSNVSDSGEWALRICEQVNAYEYVNPYGGIDLFDKNKFEESNIQLKFMKMNDLKYPQRRNSFESNLSIIDVMMFNSKEKIKEMLELYEVKA